MYLFINCKICVLDKKLYARKSKNIGLISSRQFQRRVKEAVNNAFSNDHHIPKSLVLFFALV